MQMLQEDGLLEKDGLLEETVPPPSHQPPTPLTGQHDVAPQHARPEMTIFGFWIYIERRGWTARMTGPC